MAQRSDPSPEERARILQVIKTAEADRFLSARPWSLDGLVNAASVWIRPGALRAQIQEHYLALAEAGAFLVLARGGEGGYTAKHFLVAPAMRWAGQEMLALIVFVDPANYDVAKQSTKPMATLVGLEWDRIYQAPK